MVTDVEKIGHPLRTNFIVGVKEDGTTEFEVRPFSSYIIWSKSIISFFSEVLEMPKLIEVRTLWSD